MSKRDDYHFDMVIKALLTLAFVMGAVAALALSFLEA